MMSFSTWMSPSGHWSICIANSDDAMMQYLDDAILLMKLRIAAIIIIIDSS